jgi:adenosine deaminase
MTVAPLQDGIIELHVHLGGAVPIHRLYESAVDRGIRLPVQTYDEFVDHLHRRADNSGSLEKYLEVYEVVERIQSGPQALREAVLIALNGAARTGGATRIAEGEAETPVRDRLPIAGIELRLNPMKRNGNGVWDLDRVMLAASSGVEEIQTAYKGRLRAGLLVCLGRDLPWQQNEILAEKVAVWSARGLPVVGLDLAGAESTLSLEDPQDLRRMARIFDKAGPHVGRTVHCGETRSVSLDTFIATMDALHPSRVGHPVVVARSWWEHKDDRGLKLMAERKITAELCVVSNLLTGAIADVDQYREFLELLDAYGVEYTFSTDAPALQKTTLGSELALLRTRGAATEEQLKRSFATSQKATFLRPHTPLPRPVVDTST